jgi:hypothetical protein
LTNLDLISSFESPLQATIFVSNHRSRARSTTPSSIFLLQLVSQFIFVFIIGLRKSFGNNGWVHGTHGEDEERSV